MRTNCLKLKRKKLKEYNEYNLAEYSAHENKGIMFLKFHY